MMSDAFIGQIVAFAGNFAPRNWMLCQGQLLGIAQNQTLFAILGTTYGGNGTTNFQLPDLRGRAAVSAGQGPSLSNYTLGEPTGTENVTLSVSQMPSHTHLVNASATNAGVLSPAGALLAQGIDPKSKDGIHNYSAPPAATPVQLAPSTIAPAGSSQPTPIVQPVLPINYIICVNGLFPSRN